MIKIVTDFNYNINTNTLLFMQFIECTKYSLHSVNTYYFRIIIIIFIQLITLLYTTSKDL